MSLIMSAEDINSSFFSNFNEAPQEDGEEIPGPPALGQVGGFTSPTSHAQNPSQTVDSVVRRPTAPQIASSRRRSRWDTPAGEEKGDVEDLQGNFEEGPALDQSEADVQTRAAAAAAVLRAQADAKQQAFKNKIWASNDNGATVMAHVCTGSYHCSCGKFYHHHDTSGYPSSQSVCQAVGELRHSPRESLPSVVDAMMVNVPGVYQAILKVTTLEGVEAADVLKHAVALTFGRFGAGQPQS